MKISFYLQRFASVKRLDNKANNFENETANRIIYALGGNDSILNHASNVTISGGNGNDSVVSYGQSYNGQGNNVSISGGAGADGLYNYGGNKVKIFGDAGNDYIDNLEGTDTVTIDGGTGNDQIRTWNSDHVTITGGKGNDSIQLGSFMYYSKETAKNTVIKYASGDGNDTIFGFDSNDTLHITSGSYKTSVKGNDFIVTVGKQKIVLKDAVGDDHQKVIIKNSKGKLDIYNDWSVITANSNGETITANNVTVKSAKSGGLITSYGDKVRIIGNNGSDSFFNAGNKVTISSGNGKDSITSIGDNVSISAGVGNDDITSTGDKSTVNGGKGNDFINLGYVDQYSKDSQKTVVQYANGDGNDTIRGFNTTDTLKITSGSYTASANADNDVIIKVGKGSITLKNATGQNIYITDAKGKTTKKFFPTVSSSSALWFADENNFVSSDNLSEITENNLVPSALEKISATNFENLTNENNFVTFTEK